MRKVLSLAVVLALCAPAQAAQPLGRVIRSGGAPTVRLNLAPTATTTGLSAHHLPKLLTPGVTPQGVPAVAPQAALPSVLPAVPAVEAAAADAAGPEAAIDAARHLVAAPETSDARFDGSKPAQTAAEPVKAPGKLKRLVSALKKPVKLKLPGDDHGGPTHEPRSWKGNVAYGLKWGLNLAGLSAIIDVVAKPVLGNLPWLVHLPSAALEAAGRVELLAKMGPEQISEALATSPWLFMGTSVPMMTLTEELVYRVVQFGVSFLALASVRPVTDKISRGLEKLPAIPMRSIAQKGLELAGKISSVAFPLAAAFATLNFAAAHFEQWGIHPYVLTTHATLGYALAHVAYRSRSLTAPLTAHLSFNLLTMVGGALALHYMLPMAASLYTLALGLAGMAALWYTLRTTSKLSAKALAGAALALAMLGGAAAWQAQPLNASAETPTKTAVAAQQAPATQSAAAPQAAAVERQVMTTPEIVKARKPGVVQVRTQTGSGSGFIVSPDGFIVTNAHVVDGAGERVMIQLTNGQMVPAKVLALNNDKDIAFLQLPPAVNGWPTVPLGDDAQLVEGMRIVAMGFPMGQPFSVSEGIVSGMGFRGNLYVSHIQHDAAVNPGNSGGPLFNERGEVIAMNTAILTRSGGFDGISFAIPASDIKKAAEQFRASGNINSSWLGIIVDQRAQARAQSPGVIVEEIRPGSPAAAAGLKPGDVIVGIGGRPFPGDGQSALQILAKSLAVRAPGAELALSVVRQTEKSVDHHAFTAKLGDKQ